MTDACIHRIGGSNCPISKTPCLGECIYANILDDISLAMIGLDVAKEEVFYQNKLATEIFKEFFKPKDYYSLSTLFFRGGEVPFPSEPCESQTVQLGRNFIGYSVYPISKSYYWIYLSDITEKMRLNAIAEAVNTMGNLGYIFSGIRHELGNPINSAKTSLTVCKKNLRSYSRETIEEFIDRVLSDINRVEILLKDLKNFSMYENPECAVISIDSFLSNLLAIVERDFGAKNIRVKTLIRAGAETGFFDARAMQHVMLNLLTNSYDALDGVDAPLIAISAYRTGDEIVIKIMDNGTGIPLEQKEHLFKPFSTSKSHGTGLGLVIVKKMMLKMNGSIEIESQEKVGTTVTLKLPAFKGSNA